MKKSLFALLLPMFAFAAQSPFDGTWKIDLNKSQWQEKPEVLLLQNGIFDCSTCTPAIKVIADGTDQPLTGSKDVDTVAVKIVNDRTVESTAKKGRKIIWTTEDTSSADGKVSTLEYVRYPERGRRIVTYTITYLRVAPGPAGSHAISGSWRIQNMNLEGNDLTITYKSKPNGLIMTTPTGETFDAKFDGKENPIKDTTGLTVSLTKVNDRSIDTTNKLDGKVVAVTHMTVSADGKTLTIKSENKVQGTTTTITATKQ